MLTKNIWFIFHNFMCFFEHACFIGAVCGYTFINIIDFSLAFGLSVGVGEPQRLHIACEPCLIVMLIFVAL